MSTSFDQPIHRMMSFYGGPAALINLRVLRSIARDIPTLLDKVDLFAGVSEGSFAALLLASRIGAGSSSAEALDEAVEMLDEIITTVEVCWTGALRFVSGFGPLDTSEALRDVLIRYFGDMTLGHLGRRALCPSFELSSWSPRLFQNLDGVELDLDRLIVDVALASSAFPMIVATHSMPTIGPLSPGGQFVDGSVMTNDPTMIAIAASVKSRAQADPDEGGWAALKDMRVLTAGAIVTPVMPLGFGAAPIGLPLIEAMRELASAVLSGRSGLSWGWMDWFVIQRMMFVNLMLEGSATQVITQCKQLLGRRGYRLLAPEVNETFAGNEILFSPAAEVIEQSESIAREMTDPPCAQVVDIMRWLEREWV
jgi:hypothetical protein